MWSLVILRNRLVFCRCELRHNKDFQVPSNPPTTPESWEKVFGDLEKVIFNGSSHWNHPHFFAYFSAGIGYHSILADIISSGLGSVGFTWIACPPITELEKITLDWLVDLTSLPVEFKNSHPGHGCGIIQSSASDSTLIAIMTARAAKVEFIKQNPSTFQWLINSTSEHLRSISYWTPVNRTIHDSTDIITPYYHDPRVFKNFVMYFTDQAHSSVEKGAMLAGVRFRKLRSVRGYMENYEMDSKILIDAIEVSGSS